jgi:hypothetical protein
MPWLGFIAATIIGLLLGFVLHEGTPGTPEEPEGVGRAQPGAGPLHDDGVLDPSQRAEGETQMTEAQAEAIIELLNK